MTQSGQPHPPISSQSFGNFASELLQANPCLLITFSAGLVPQQQFWPNSSLSAKFIADYLAMFFAAPTQPTARRQQQTAIADAVRYIVNELLENAVKFSYSLPEFPTQLGLHIHADKIVVFVTNTTQVDNLAKLTALIQELTTIEPVNLYIDRLEKNLDDDNRHVSGLGFITILSNYATQLGWRFEPIPTVPQAVLVTTMVQLSYSKQADYSEPALAETQDGN